MAKLKRYLVLSDLAVSWTEEFAERQRTELAACPEAQRYTDEEAEDFLMTALSFDAIDREHPSDLGRPLRKVGIAHPPELAYDAYRLGRFIFRRWDDAALRRLIMGQVLQADLRDQARLLRRNLQDALAMVERNHLAAGLAALRWSGLSDMVPAVKAAFSPELMAEYETILRYGKLKLHQFVTEPEPARAPSRWEQQKLLRRIHLRQVQMRALGRSLHHLRHERKALLDRLRELNAAVPELGPLSEQLEAVRAELLAAESRHAEAVAAQARQFEAETRSLREQIQAVRTGYAKALALRGVLLGQSQR